VRSGYDEIRGRGCLVRNERVLGMAEGTGMTRTAGGMALASRFVLGKVSGDIDI